MNVLPLNAINLLDIAINTDTHDNDTSNKHVILHNKKQTEIIRSNSDM